MVGKGPLTGICTAHPGPLGGVVAVHIVPDLSNSACHLAVGETLLEHTIAAMEIAALASLTGNVKAFAGTAIATMKTAIKGLSRNRYTRPLNSFTISPMSQAVGQVATAQLPFSIGNRSNATCA